MRVDISISSFETERRGWPVGKMAHLVRPVSHTWAQVNRRDKRTRGNRFSKSRKDYKSEPVRERRGAKERYI